MLNLVKTMFLFGKGVPNGEYHKLVVIVTLLTLNIWYILIYLSSLEWEQNFQEHRVVTYI